jgi:hypothetical protein
MRLRRYLLLSKWANRAGNFCQLTDSPTKPVPVLSHLCHLTEAGRLLRPSKSRLLVGVVKESRTTAVPS